MNLNPIYDCKTYQIKNILVAFENTLDASTTDLTSDMGRTGKKISGSSCGKPGIVLINEFMTARHVIIESKSTFNYYSPHSLTTTSMIGQLLIADRTAGLFSNFLKRSAERLGISEAHIAFSWKIFFIGEKPNGEEVIVPINQLVFNMVHFTQSFSAALGRRYNLFFVADYNTFGQMPNFTHTFQANITHKDGNLHKEMPQPTGVSGGIQPRAVEDGIKLEPRNQRREKSKPMKTLKDVFEGYKMELDDMKYTHKAQLQHWLSIINEKFTKKITPPKQTADLPIDYDITLDSKYNSYKIDNRNLIFEQPEQDQRIEGIRSISLPVGNPIPKNIDELMILSKKVGEDAVKELPISYKSNTCVIKDCSARYKVKVEVKQIDIPKNSQSVDTGPGESAINPLTFTFQDGVSDDVDIISIFLKSSSEPIRKVIENPVNSPEAAVIYGNREQATVERATAADYFNSGFTGLRAMIAPDKLSGTENFKNYGDLLSLIKNQSTHYSMSIRGNPYLLHDLHRLPSDVYGGSPGNAILYKQPEFLPLYLRLIVRIKPDLNKLSSNPGEGDPTESDDDNVYYYEKWMHMFSITNIIRNGTLEHNIELLRTDEIT